MAVALTINGSSFSYPDGTDEEWGADATAAMQAVASSANTLFVNSIVNDDTTGGAAVPASAEIVKTHGTEIDARLLTSTFTNHKARHQNGGADELNVAGLSGELADNQTPKTHQSSHNSGGGDALKLDDLASPEDNTDLNVSTSAHGLCPKLPNNALTFLDGTGSYATPGNLIGSIVAYGNNSTPSGYLLCDGSAVNRTTYANLFTAVGTTWGVGDGSTTFNLPDLQGMFLRGTGSHGSLNMEDGNDFAGPSVGSSENDLYQSHKHTVFGNVASAAGSSKGQPLSTTGDNDSTASTPITDGTQGTRFGDETRPVNYGIKYVIKY